jgi:hypothetical protein
MGCKRSHALTTALGELGKTPQRGNPPRHPAKKNWPTSASLQKSHGMEPESLVRVFHHHPG